MGVGGQFHALVTLEKEILTPTGKEDRHSGKEKQYFPLLGIEPQSSSP
jgi:hypothetical protein